MGDHKLTRECLIGGVKYEIGVDDSGNTYARTYNTRYKMWVQLEFSQVGNNAAVQSVLDTLKSDYLQRMSACE